MAIVTKGSAAWSGLEMSIWREPDFLIEFRFFEKMKKSCDLDGFEQKNKNQLKIASKLKFSQIKKCLPLPKFCMRSSISSDA